MKEYDMIEDNRERSAEVEGLVGRLREHAVRGESHIANEDATTTTPAARVSGTISLQMRIAGWHDAADYVAGEWIQSRILAAIHSDPEPQPVASHTHMQSALRALAGDKP